MPERQWRSATLADGEPGFPVTPPAVVAEPLLDLTWADLSSCDLWNAIAALDGVETVRHLLLRNARNTDARALARLAELCPRTRVLDLRACPQLRGDSLAALSSFRDLAALKLGDNGQLDDSAIDGLLKCQSLIFLELVNATGMTGRAIGRLADGSVLESLLLGGSPGVDDECVGRLSALCGLTDLRLARCPISDRALVGLDRCRNLRHLNVNGCERLGNAAVAAVSSCRELVELRMSGCQHLTDVAWTHVAPLTGLGALSVSGSVALSDSGAEMLGKFQHLREFRARGCSRFGDGAARALSRCRRLRVLDAAGWNGLTHRGLAAIAGLPELEECGVSGIDDRGLGAFGRTFGLRVLALIACPRASLAGFRQLGGLVNLEQLALIEGTPADTSVLHSVRHLPALREVVIDPRQDPETPSPAANAADSSAGFSFRVVERAVQATSIVPERLTIRYD